MTKIRDRHRAHRDGGDKRWFGIILLIIGSIILMKKFDLFYFNFHTMWPWILVAVGTMIGVKSRFRNNAWWILILVGAAHLIPVFTIAGVSSKALLIPATLIILGLVFIFRPERKKKPWGSCDENIVTNTNTDSLLNVDVTFGGHKEIVTSKNFSGGKVNTTFGGAEINLMNADSTEKTINIHMKVAFGGVEIIVPSHWIIKNKISNSLGSVEDNRNFTTNALTEEDTITLVLSGSCNFGSIEIKSY